MERADIAIIGTGPAGVSTPTHNCLIPSKYEYPYHNKRKQYLKIQQITSLFRKGCIFRLPILPPIKIRKQNIHKREYEISHDHPGIQRHPLFHTLKY